MSTLISAPTPETLARALPVPTPDTGFLPRIIEAVTLVAVGLSPWAFGAVGPFAEFLLYAAVALLLALWAARLVLAGAVPWAKCPVAVSLAALFLLAISQTVALPPGMLATIAPATAQLYARLLPAHPEVLPGMEPGPATGAGTLSVYPAATQQELVRLLAVFLLFVVVRNNLGAPACLRRLSIVLLANGAFLSFFGIVQFVTSGPTTLYWTYPAPNNVFGPFVCKNHFSFYVNLCFGVGVGLLWAQPAGRAQGLLQRLRSPQILLIVGALGLILAGVVTSLSRGGLLALAGAAVLCLGLRHVRSSRPGDLSGALLGAVLVGALALTWLAVAGFDFDPMVSRLATLRAEHVAKESRLQLWTRVLRLVGEHPVWGTGFGTFPYVELMTRDNAEDNALVWENAHNEYIEALVEGGLLRFTLSLLAIGLLCRQIARALGRYRDSPTAGLVWGGLFAVLTTLIHSVSDFGLHLPAIAVVVTVLCAQLSALGDAMPAGFVRKRGVAGWAAAAAALALGFALCGNGWSNYTYASLRQAATELHGATEDQARQLHFDLLQEAVRRRPDYARAQVELAQAYLQRGDDAAACRQRQDRSATAALLVLDALAAPGVPAAGAAVAAAGLWPSLQEATEADLVQRYRVPALRAFLNARRACPVFTEPHLALATYHSLLEQAEPRAAYLERVKYLAPADPQLWYICGVQELPSDPDQAVVTWRHCLELSETMLPAILTQARTGLPEDALAQILPDVPSVLLAGALQLYPEPTAAEQRRHLLERGLLLLDRQPGSLRGEDHRTRAQIYAHLERSEEAIAAYRRALSLEPTQVAWRYELATVLLAHGQARAARYELLVVLDQQPGLQDARNLLNLAARRIAEKE